MNGLIEELKSYWNEFPRGFRGIFGVLAIIIVLAWGLSEPLAGFVPKDGIQKDSVWIKTLIASGLAGLIYFVFDAFYYICRRGAALRVDEDVNRCLLAEIDRSDCSEIRIFASGGDEAKARFIRLTQHGKSTQKAVNVRVLLRTDGTEKRNQSLEELARKWKKDIDDATAGNKSGYRFKTTFATYECPVMLRGYVFGENAAALSWYAREGALRSKPTMPTIIVKVNSGTGGVLVHQAIEVFDFYFAKGTKL